MLKNLRMNFMGGVFAAAGLALLQQAAFAADVAVHDVYEAADAGHLREAQAMMQQVLRDHPNSAKAHFVEAELLSKQGQLAAARTELATAERLEPGLSFAKPAAVETLKARLSGQSNRGAEPNARTTTLPWGLLMLGVILIAVVVMFVRSLRQRVALQNALPYNPSAPGYGGYGPNYGPGYGSPNYGPMSGGGMGSGILGGLATGAAVGAGMVAGEALAHRLMDGSNSDRVVPAPDDQVPQNWNDDLGGNDFGMTDSSSWDDGGAGLGGDDWS